jgi:hypothetical protein
MVVWPHGFLFSVRPRSIANAVPVEQRRGTRDSDIYRSVRTLQRDEP